MVTKRVKRPTRKRNSRAIKRPDNWNSGGARGKLQIARERALVEFGKKYLDAFSQSEQATIRLNQALQNTGNAAAAKTYDDLAQSMAQLSTFSKPALVNVETLLTSVGNVKPDNMQAALKATTDLAAGMAGSGMSLEQAAKLVAKAAGSDGEAIGKLKAILQDAAPKGSDFAAIMEAINTKFGGSGPRDLERPARNFFLSTKKKFPPRGVVYTACRRYLAWPSGARPTLTKKSRSIRRSASSRS